MSSAGLPQGVQDLYETVLSHLETREGREALEALVEPYRTAQRSYAAGHGLYSPHPAYLVRAEGDRTWTPWPDDKPMPTLMDLLMRVHEKQQEST